MSVRTERFVELIVAALALVSVALICLEFLVELTAGQRTVVYGIDAGICVVFAAEFAWRLRQANSKKSFLSRSWYEILAMLPAYAFLLLEAAPLFGALVRSLRLLRVVRLLVMFARMRRTLRTTSWLLQKSYLGWLLSVSFCIVFAGSVGAYLLERGSPDAQITNLGDSVWWSLATVTTVGYGDMVPTRIVGRVLGVMLMFVGIAFISVFISALGTAMTERRLTVEREEPEDLRDAIIRQVHERLSKPDKLTARELVVLEGLSNSLVEPRDRPAET